ncbi:MAG: UDP-N-acetylglucosamine 1-carboxyvinyltransferase, partial [Bacteroidota bacterium]|nr:UDP-N-acetylglucosamine 1-carboxyvinyltransferase [Bacteroidota bacterium]
MEKFIIEGQRKLEGDLHPQGAKNEALQIVSAVLLTPEKVIIKNIPEIVDVLNLIDLMRHLGVVVERIEKGHFSFIAKDV